MENLKICPICKTEHERGGIYCKDACKQQAWRNRNANRNGTTVTPVPEAREYIISPTVERHNIGAYFIIESEGYIFDKFIWDKRPNGRYVHKYIRDAVGYPYDKSRAGQKPPLSVVKGHKTDNRKVEVFINEGAGIDSDEARDALLAKIKDRLEDDLEAELSGPYAKKFKDGKDITDYTVPCPLAKAFGEANKDMIPFQPEQKAGEKYKPMKIDGSHPDSFEGNDKQQAEAMREMQLDMGVTNVSDTQQAALVARAPGYIIQTNNKVNAISEEVRALKQGTEGIERAVEGIIESNVRLAHIQEDEMLRPDLMAQSINADGPQLLLLKQELTAEKEKREDLEDRMRALEGKSMWNIFLEYFKGGK